MFFIFIDIILYRTEGGGSLAPAACKRVFPSLGFVSLAAGARESDAITEDDIFPKQFVLLGLLSQRRRSTMELGAANSYGHAQQHSVHTNATKPLPTLVMCLLSAIATNTIHAPLNAGTAAQSQLQPLGV